MIPSNKLLTSPSRIAQSNSVHLYVVKPEDRFPVKLSKTLPVEFLKAASPVIDAQITARGETSHQLDKVALLDGGVNSYNKIIDHLSEVCKTQDWQAIDDTKTASIVDNYEMLQIAKDLGITRLVQILQSRLDRKLREPRKGTYYHVSVTDIQKIYEQYPADDDLRKTVVRNLGIAYHYLGDTKFRDRKYTSLIEFWKKNKQLREEWDNQTILAEARELREAENKSKVS